MESENNKLAVVILGNDFTIHSPTASSNFVRNMARGFQEHGARTYVINYGCEYGKFNYKADGVNFYIPLEQPERSNKFIVRGYYRLKRYLNLFLFLSRSLPDCETKLIISYSGTFSTLFLTYLLKIFFFDLSFHYASEHPLRYRPKFFKRILLQHLYPRLVYFLNNGLLSVSTGLNRFFPLFQKGGKLNFIFPPVTDPDHFSTQSLSPYSFEYITYCGTISREKDGLEILIRSFALANKKNPEVQLVLIGKSESNLELSKIMELVGSLKIEEKVVFAGLISYDELPRYLNNSRILALSRPTNLQNETGFPSKLTEYLATKRPVVITSVSDIPKYFSNEVNAFIAEPGNVKEFAEKLILALSDKDLSDAVGRNGFELTKTIFNYNYQAKELLKILQEHLH